MPIFQSAQALANYQRKRAAAFQRAQGAVTRQEADRLVKRMNTRVQGLLSGTRTTRELAIMGHPYRRSRRRLTTTERQAREVLRQVRLLPINAQTDELRRRTRVYAVALVLGKHQRLILKLRSDVAHALYQIDPENKGTRHMRPRGFWKALQKSYQKYDAAQIRAARLKAKRAADKYLRST